MNIEKKYGDSVELKQGIKPYKTIGSIAYFRGGVGLKNLVKWDLDEKKKQELRKNILTDLLKN